MKKKQLKKALQSAKLEIDRLSSQNTVLVQSIQFAIKEANLVLLANNNGKPSTVCNDGFYVKELDVPLEAQSKEKEWIPQAGDMVEIIEGHPNTHRFKIGEVGVIEKQTEYSDQYWYIENKRLSQGVHVSCFKKHIPPAKVHKNEKVIRPDDLRSVF